MLLTLINRNNKKTKAFLFLINQQDQTNVLLIEAEGHWENKT